MKKIESQFNYDDTKYTQQLEQRYLELQNNIFYQQWISENPHSKEEVLLQLSKLETMVKNEEEAAKMTKIMVGDTKYYQSLDYNFEVIYKLYPCLKEDEKNMQHKKYFVGEIPLKKHLLVSLAQEAEHESQEYIAIIQTVIQNTKMNKGIYLYGNIGVGKTYLMHGVLNAYAKSIPPKKVMAIRCVDLIESLRQMQSNSKDEYDRLMKQLKSVPILLIDDISSEVNDQNAHNVLFTILDERYNASRITLFTSNYSLNELYHKLAIDRYGNEMASSANRIIDRIRAMCAVVEMKGNNRRQ